MNPRKPMGLRAVRVPDALWEEAQEAAAVNSEAVSDVIRDALTKYVAKHRRAQGKMNA